MGTQIRFDQAVLPPAILIIILIILGIVVFRSYRAERFRRYPKRLVRTLIALRILALAAVGFILLKPELFHLHETREPGTLLLLADMSESMDISDAPGKRYIRAREIAEEIASSIGDRLDVRAFGFSAFPEPVDRSAIGSLEIQASGATNIGGSIREAVQSEAEAGIAAVVVISDGQHNTGPGPEAVAALLRRRDIPVFAVGVGSESAFRDLEIRDFSGPSLVFRGEAARLTVRIVNFGFDRAEIPFRIRIDGYRPPATGGPAVSPEGTMIVDRSLPLPPPGTEEQHTVTFVPKDEGVYRLVAEIDTLPGEEVAENNARRLDLEVTRKRLRVLVIEANPRWEYTFLLRALRMDRRFAAGGLLEMQDGDYRYQGAELFPDNPMGGKVHHPPLDPDWSKLDSVVLGDVPAGDLAAGSLERLRRQVEEKGLALAVIPGERTVSEGGLASSPIGPLLPFRNLGAPVKGPFGVIPTASGLTHPLMQVGPTTIPVGEFWEGLSPVWGVYRTGEPSAGALVLARTSGEPGYPVIAIRNAGRGRVLELAAEDTWRWRVADPTGRVVGAAPATFWRQAIRWLITGRTDDPGTGVRLLVEKSLFTRGERVEIEARVDTPARIEPGTVRVSGEIIGPDGIAEPVQFNAVGGGGPEPEAGAAYRYAFVPLSFGGYTVRVSAFSGEEPLGRDEKVFFVSESGLERTRTSLNRRLLQELAGSTGGEYFDADEAGRVAELIPDRETIRVQPVTTRLWDNPFIYLVFVAAVGTEWFLRKRRDMA